MIDALVFSRDRPMQLDACLRSMYRHLPLGQVIALTYATTSDYREGYDRLAADTPARIWDQDSFRLDALSALASLEPLVLCQCDDSITFGDALDPEAAFEDDVISLSIRLGRNTVYCHPRDLHHGLPEFEERPPFLVWDWHDAPDGDLFAWQGREGDFGYPYSLDGNIHRRDSLLEWLDKATFTNPNTMEGCIVHAIGQRRDMPPLLACYPESIQVGLPINVVNQTHGNRFGLVHPHEPAELNRRFLAGERINLDAMDFSGVIGAHQELELMFA
jgi:hypothetical protein